MNSRSCRVPVGICIAAAYAAPAFAQTTDPFALIASKGSSAIASIYPLMRMVGFFGLRNR